MRWKQRFDNMALGGKFRAIGMLTTAIALAISSAVWLVADLRTEMNGVLREASASADLIATQSTAALTFRDRNAARDVLSSFEVNRDIVTAAVLLPDGAVYARFDREPALKAPIDLGQVPAAGTWHAFGRDSMRIAKPIVLGGERLGAVFVRMDMTPLETRWRGSP